MNRLFRILFLVSTVFTSALPSPLQAMTRLEAAETILELSQVGEVTATQIIMPEASHSQNVFVWHETERPHEIPLPFSSTWFAMIDRGPYNKWAHSCLWIYLNDENPAESLVEERDWYPRLFYYGSYEEIPLSCVDVPAHPELVACQDTEDAVKKPPLALPEGLLRNGAECVWAYLLAGGGEDIGSFREDVRLFADALENASVPDSQIVQKLNGDYDANIGVDLWQLSRRMRERDSLIILFAGHGKYGYVKTHVFDPPDDYGLGNSSQLLRTELQSYIQPWSNNVCRIYVFVASCYSGSFLPMAGHVSNTIVVTSCTSTQKEMDGYFAPCIAERIPGRSAAFAKNHCDYELRSQIRRDHPWDCYWWPENCEQVAQYRASTGIQHENEAIAFCCDPPVPVRRVRLGSIKGLYR